MVRKGARNNNAAKLIAIIYLTSPDGAKFALEEAQYGTLYEPGNELDIRLQNQ